MGTSSHPNFDDWVILNRAALQIETEITRKRLLQLQGLGPGPTVWEVEAADRLRSAVSSLLVPAMEDLRLFARTCSARPWSDSDEAGPDRAARPDLADRS